MIFFFFFSYEVFFYSLLFFNKQNKLFLTKIEGFGGSGTKNLKGTRVIREKKVLIFVKSLFFGPDGIMRSFGNFFF